MKKEKLNVIDGETLMDLNLPPTSFCVETLLPQGVTILGGAPKVGKSWLVLDLCVRVAKGEAIWNLPTTQGTTLYLCLEDTLRRVQERLNCITDEVPASAFFAVAAQTLTGGLCEQIEDFIIEHPDTRLVVIDTFQMVRNGGTEVSYGNDYAEVRQLKELADRLGISLLLVHHLRKQDDSDPLNKLSGSTGLSGAVDAVFVLEKVNRGSDEARLLCTGRDIEHREMKLRFDKDSCRWELMADSLEQPELLSDRIVFLLSALLRERGEFIGTATELTSLIDPDGEAGISSRTLSRTISQSLTALDFAGIHAVVRRSNGKRLIELRSADGDDKTAAGKIVPIDPAGEKEARNHLRDRLPRFSVKRAREPVCAIIPDGADMDRDAAESRM